jgi:hypothetical protein
MIDHLNLFYSRKRSSNKNSWCDDYIHTKGKLLEKGETVG